MATFETRKMGGFRKSRKHGILAFCTRSQRAYERIVNA